jgi:carbon-monoxide dehydrogenase catalytic subunit
MSSIPKSIDPASLEMIQKAQKDQVEIVWDRFEAQQPQCGFGELGVCCKICLQGPCRINPFGEPKHGICGATADTIVARNLLRSVTGGAATHVDHAYEAVEILGLAVEGKVPYGIEDVGKLHAVAAKLGLATENRTPPELAAAIVQIAFGDFGNASGAPMRWLTATAPAERVEVWKSLGILPRNPDREIRTALHQSTMGVDADPVNLLLATAKLGLVDGYAGLHLGTDIQDIVFGTPQPVKTEANLGVLKPNHVNIVVHGHIPFFSEKMVEWTEKLEEEARLAGAEGIQLAGMCCTGNEILMRQGIPSAGNYLNQELAIITGAVDALVVDVQCIMPSLARIAACYHTKVITTMPIAKMPGAEHVEFTPEKADECAQQIVRKAIEAYKNRDRSRVKIPDYKAEVWGGFSVEAIVGALKCVQAEDPLQPLIENIKNGNILGAVGVVGCNNVKTTQDYNTVELVKALLKENVLVVATGCAAHGLGKAGLLNPQGTEKYAGDGLKAVLTAVGHAAGLNAPLPPVLHMGSCVDNSRIADLLAALASYLGVAIKDLPAAASAPELHHEKALSIGTWAVALGLLTHVGLVPPVLGSPLLAKLLTNDLEQLVGGKFYVETDPLKAATGIVAHIRQKRRALGI